MAIRPSRRTTETRRTSGYDEFGARYPEFVERIRLLRERRDRRLARLAAMSVREQRGEVRKLLRSGSMHLPYAFDALKAKQQLHDASPETVEALAARCDPFSRFTEHITTRFVRKGRKTRMVQDFGPQKRMHQLLVADLLRTLHPPRQDQFLLNGGMPKALKAIEVAFREGYTHAVEVDLIDFYGGVRLPGLANMLRPLPGAVVDNVVWDVAARQWLNPFLYMTGMSDLSASGLVGLSLGATTSPVVGEVIIRHLLDTAQMGQVVTYADNILVLGRGRDDALNRAAHLREVALGLDAGPLAPQIGEPAGFRDEHTYVEFAGHWGRAIRHQLNWEPNGRKQQEHRVADVASTLSAEAIAEAERKVTHCRRAYPMWRTADRWEAQRLAELAAVRYYQDARPEHLTDAQHKLAIAYLTSNGLDLLELLPEGTIERHRERRMVLWRETQRLLEAMLPGNTPRAA
ncbi:MAG: hypothetical protein J0L50_06205 [Sphingomonadales bacterium]|nr:hypothetical protein [Sphingomonadales bacterium]